MKVIILQDNAKHHISLKTRQTITAQSSMRQLCMPSFECEVPQLRRRGNMKRTKFEILL